jgi:hypothetical protein
VLKRRKSSDTGKPDAREAVGDAIEDLELDDAEADPDAVTGGRGAAAPGPLPIPYPNVTGG